MNAKATFLISVLAFVALLVVGFASAAVPNVAPYANGLAYGYASYGSYPVNPSIYNNYYGNIAQPVRIGGWFGQNSAFLIGLKPGVFDSPTMNYGMRNAIASSYYPRVGGWFGGGYTGLIGGYGASYYGGYGGGYYGGYGGSVSTPSYYFHGPM